MPSRDRWQTAWGELGAKPPTGLFDELMARYGEPHRHYHTAQHLDECFVQMARDLAERPAEVELALWFHDSIYEPKRQDNEAKSAAWARDSALSAGVAAESAQRLYALVMATRHDAVPQGRDEQALVDIDLSILGAQFLARPTIYSTARFRERLEAPARANLARSIAQL